MPNFFEIPIGIGIPQKFSITLSQVEYHLTLHHWNADEAGWTLDIADASDNPIVNGIPLVTGADLLEQYAHLGFKGKLWVQTTEDPDAPPTFANLGDGSKLYWVSP